MKVQGEQLNKQHVYVKCISSYNFSVKKNTRNQFVLWHKKLIFFSFMPLYFCVKTGRFTHSDKGWSYKIQYSSETLLLWKDKLLNHCVKEGCKNEVWLSQDQMPNRALPATKWNMASPPLHRQQNHLGQQTTSATTDTQPRLRVRNHHQQGGTNSAARPNVGYKYHQILCILHHGEPGVSRINNLCRARESCQIQQCLQTERKAHGMFTEPFQRRMPLINQFLTAMLRRREKNFVEQGKSL